MPDLVEPVVSLLLQSISNLLSEEASLVGNVRNEVQLLQSALMTMHAMLKDAEPKQDRFAVVKDWIIQSRELAYEADGLLKRFAFNTKKRKWYEFYTQHNFSVEIQNLKTKILALNKSFQDNGLTAIVISEKEGSSSSKKRLFRRTYSHLKEEEKEDFVGLESDVHILVQQLVNENQRVVSIYGMGGLGKTTIAKRVYNNASVMRCFDDRVWVCVSQQWQTEDILQGILIKLMPKKRERIEKWRCEELVRELSKVQRDRKCLIVLDDIWEKDAWEAIKDAFSLQGRGSKIIITTRNKDVVEHVDPNGFHLQLRFLEKDESWELLRKKALKRRDNEQGNKYVEKMEALGRKMAELCGGLPLALIVLGGILATRSTLSEWELEYKTIQSCLGKGKRDKFNETVQKILALSYYDLSEQLRLCFLYLGTFPEDSEIDAEEICELWLAEGFVSEMDDAKSVLDELVERCMVLAKLSEFSEIKRRWFKSCRLHDMMRDLCILKAKEENFMRFIDNANDYRDGEESLSINNVHRLVIYKGLKIENGLAVPEEERMKYTRMLKLNGAGYSLPEILRYQFKCLHVLAVENHLHLAYAFKFSHVLGKLIHLRYLSLRGSEFFMDNVLSHSSLGNLIHLQTLDLRECRNELIPNALRNLRELKYLYLPADSDFVKKSDDPLRLDGLSKLEILENYIDSFCEPQELFKLANLGVFTIADGRSGLDINAFTVVADYVYHSDSLQYVSIHVSLRSDEAFECPVFVQKLLCARSMKKLWISGSHMRSWFPEYEEGLSTSEAGIVHLELNYAYKMKSNPVETLNKLPNLRELYPGNITIEEMISHATNFPQLRSLHLEWFQNLKSWIVEKGAFPQLRTLILQNFPKMQSWIVEREAMPNLSTLHLIGFRSLNELPEGLKVLKTLKDIKYRRVTESLKRQIEAHLNELP